MSDLRENSENYWKVVAGLLFLAFIYQGWCRNKAEIRCNELSTKIEITNNLFKKNFSNAVKRVDSVIWFNEMGVGME